MQFNTYVRNPSSARFLSVSQPETEVLKSQLEDLQKHLQDVDANLTFPSTLNCTKEQLAVDTTITMLIFELIKDAKEVARGLMKKET